MKNLLINLRAILDVAVVLAVLPIYIVTLAVCMWIWPDADAYED